MSNAGDPRGRGTEPPKWWLDLFNQERSRRLAENDAAKRRGFEPPYPETGEELGVLLADAIDRPKPWHRTPVTNFINGERYTYEMMEAFCRLYQLPRYEIVLAASNEKEAWEHEMYVSRRGLALERPERVAEIDRRAAEVRRAVEAARAADENDAGSAEIERLTPRKTKRSRNVHIVHVMS